MSVEPRAILKLSIQQPDNGKRHSIKATVIDEASPILSVISSIVRQELNPMESTEALQKLKESCGKDTTNRQLANLVGKSENNISERLYLNDLPQEIKKDAKENNILSFRLLKQIAAEKTSNDARISKYYKLCNELQAEKPKDEIPISSQINKRVITTNKHIKSTIASMKLLNKKLDATRIEDINTQTLAQSLDEIIVQAQKLSDTLKADKQA